MSTTQKKHFKKGIKDKDRYSIIETDEQFKQYCHVCGKPTSEVHEIFMGRNRQNSKDYGLTVTLCRKHHQEAHLNAKTRHKWEQLGKLSFLEYWGDLEDFKAIFGRYYNE